MLDLVFLKAMGKCTAYNPFCFYRVTYIENKIEYFVELIGGR